MQKNNAKINTIMVAICFVFMLGGWALFQARQDALCQAAWSNVYPTSWSVFDGCMLKTAAGWMNEYDLGEFSE